MIGIETFMSQAPQRVLIIGSGTQAIYHARALHEIYPEAEVFVRGLDHESARRFCEAHAGENPNLYPCQPAEIPAGTDVVIMLTTSMSPIYNEDALKGRLVIGVGAFKPEMAEIGAHTLAGSDIYVDDPLGAREEAGDLIQAGVDWGRVRNLADALQQKPPLDRPVVFKTVGTGAWDLAAGRVAIQSI